MSDRIVNAIFGAVIGAGLLAVGYIIVWIVPLTVRSDLACQRAGYRQALVSPTRVVFCTKRERGTDIVVPFDKR